MIVNSNFSTGFHKLTYFFSSLINVFPSQEKGKSGVENYEIPFNASD